MNAARVGLVTLLCLPVAGNLRAQPRAAIVQTVDLSIPMAPAAVRIAGVPNIVYELHITNFLSVDISVTRLQALIADRPGVSIADYRGEEVGKRLGRPGLPRSHQHPHVIRPGMRAVAYLWIELPDRSAAPSALRHRIEVDVLRPGGAVHAAVEGALSTVSTEAPVVLSPPVRGGPWTAIYDPLLMGGHRTAIYTLDGRARIPARFAIDWIRLPPGGAIEKTAGPPAADWNGYGTEVLAVADATVVAAMDDIPDTAGPPVPPATPMTIENASGNYVALDLGGGRFAFYEHLKHGSVSVRVGERVKSGQVVGRLGNSGSSSIGPHLHFHVSNANSPLAAEGLPFVFEGFEHLGAFASIDALIGGSKWLQKPGDASTLRRLERPGANAVVRFP